MVDLTSPAVFYPYFTVFSLKMRKKRTSVLVDKNSNFYVCGEGI